MVDPFIRQCLMSVFDKKKRLAEGENPGLRPQLEPVDCGFSRMAHSLQPFKLALVKRH
jgi:hypothetical protein